MGMGISWLGMKEDKEVDSEFPSSRDAMEVSAGEKRPEGRL